jgi:hypothetical protein
VRRLFQNETVESNTDDFHYLRVEDNLLYKLYRTIVFFCMVSSTSLGVHAGIRQMLSSSICIAIHGEVLLEVSSIRR